MNIIPLYPEKEITDPEPLELVKALVSLDNPPKGVDGQVMSDAEILAWIRQCVL